MFSRSKSRPSRTSEGPFISVLDLGTAGIKALVCEIRSGQAAVLGVGREPLGERAALTPAGGHPALSPELLASLCDLALRRAEDMTTALYGRKVVPDQVVLGVGGDVLRSFSTTIQVQRSRPTNRITESELATLLQRAQRLAWSQVVEYPATTMPPGPDAWALVNGVVAQVQVDGQRVVDPLRFQGKTLQVTVFNVFTPAAHRQALAYLAADLELELMLLIAEPFAVARCLPAGEAIFLDVGADRTDIALVRAGGLAAIASLPQGGRGFTRQIANCLGLSYEKAEEHKIRRSLNWTGAREHETPGLAREARPPDPLAEALGDPLAIWLDGLEVLLADMAGGEPLPSRMLLCGGGSQLPEVISSLRSPTWARRLPFGRLPEVESLPPREVRGLTDRTQRLISPQDVPMMALARQAAAIHYPETLQDRLLQEVISSQNIPYRR